MGAETNVFRSCSIEEKTKDYSETIVNVLLTPRVQLTHKSNVNVGNCAGSEHRKSEEIGCFNEMGEEQVST